MSWLSAAAALLMGLLGIGLSRSWIERRLPWIKPYVDLLLVALVILSLALTAAREWADRSEPLRLEEIASQRRLSEDTKRGLLDGLRAFPNKYEVLIAYNLGDAEAQALAEELSAVFTGAGWDPPNEHGAIFTPPLAGIRLHASRPPPPELIEALRPLFDQFGHEPTPFADSGVPSGVTEIVVGTKSR